MSERSPALQGWVTTSVNVVVTSGPAPVLLVTEIR